MLFMIEVPKDGNNCLDFELVLESVDFDTVANWVECANARYGAGLFNLYRTEYGQCKISVPAMDYVVANGMPVYRIIFWDI